MNVAILQAIADSRTRIERLEALEIPAQESGASVYVAYVAVGAPDYGILRIDENGNETLLTSGLPSGCSVVNIAVSPTDVNHIAALVNFPDNPYPVFAVEDGIVIRGDPLGGYPTTGGTCLYVATDGETFEPVELPTINGDSLGRLVVGIKNVEWSGTTLVVVGAVCSLWGGTVTANTGVWRWTTGSTATAQFETTGTVSVPFLTVVGEDQDVVSLEGMNPFTSATGRIAYAAIGDSNWTIQANGSFLDVYSGGDCLPDSRTLIAGYSGGDVVLLADYRVADSLSNISTVAVLAGQLYPPFPSVALTIAHCLSAATHGVYYVDTANHLQKITDPTGTPSTTQVATDQIPNDAVIEFVRAARQNRNAVAATDSSASALYITSDGVTWTTIVIGDYVITGPVEIVDITTSGFPPSPHALSGDRHFGTLSSGQHSSQPGGTLHAAATTVVAGFATLAANGGTTAGTVIQATDSRLTNARTPTGSAGGVLNGTYPDPDLAGTTSMPADSKLGSGASYIEFESATWNDIFLSNRITVDGDIIAENNHSFYGNNAVLAGNITADNISVAAANNKIPKANGSGKIAAGYLPLITASMTDPDVARQADLVAHTGNTSNPHSVTAAQAGALAIANNLSDLANAATARGNLALGLAALETYASGTWTPAYTGTTIAGTFSYNSSTFGKYVRIGSMVTAWGRCRISAITVAPTGNMTITGLPYTPAGGSPSPFFAGSISYRQNWVVPAGGVAGGLSLMANGTSLLLYYTVAATGNSNPYPAADFTAATVDLIFSCSYQV